MKEDFLQMVWQQQLHTLPAETTDGLKIQVIRPGIRNHSDGPDFANARIVMDGLEWNGAVEIHVRADEWNQHGHQHDPAYEGVILHVVWEQNKAVFRKDGSQVPTFELRERIPLGIILRYREIISTKESLACKPFMGQIEPVLIGSMLDKVLAERLENRAEEILREHRQNGFDWILSSAWLLARCLGMKGNEEPMANLIQNLPTRMILGAKENENKILACLLGLGGFLEKTGDDKHKKLKEEYETLCAGHELKPLKILWKKSGMRPGSFPEIRIRQLAKFLVNLPKMLASLESGVPLETLLPILMGNQISHKKTGFLERHLLVNFLAPLLVAKGLHSGNQEIILAAADLMHGQKAEENSSSRLLISAGMQLKTAGESQAGKELIKHYCQKKRCMECMIGAHIIGRGPEAGIT